ncbi:FAD-binding oxidoreductase [Comamonas composti]|uniref:FAD-binding oxidoreductase n=1 Tax=Comamonas composti TaxID=408558 RepID=UPI0003F9232C|nr:FAD-binding oxidoreductase [Comamonas composti]
MDLNLLRERLLAIVGEAGIVCAADAAQRPAGFMRPEGVQCLLLVRPASTHEVAGVLRICHELRLPVVTQGGRTGLVHGADAMPGHLVLSLERMQQIEDINPRQRVARVQAGVTLQALQEAVQPHGLAFPLDLGARGSATLGGNAATNAGGNRVIRYGMMRDMVLGLEAVLADGSVVSSLNQLIKNNAGYDLKQLFLGSEGTLGVITRLVLRLRELPASQNVALVALRDFESVSGLLKHMDRTLGGGLSAFEVMWREFYELVSTPPAASAPPLPHGHAFYALIEAQGADQAPDNQRFVAALEAALESGLVADAAIAASQRECAALWALRDDVMQTARHGWPLTFDISLPLDAMQAYVQQLRAALAQRWPAHHCWVFGHLGDGNLHLVIHTGSEADRPAVEQLVYQPLAVLQGSISAEHGIGLEKKPYLHLSRNPAEIALMRALKQTLDPLNLLNPGKIF